MLNYSITNLKQAFELIKENQNQKFEKNITLDEILSKIKFKNKIVKFTNFLFVLLIICQFFILFRGFNFIDASTSLNLKEIDKNYQVAISKIPENAIKNDEKNLSNVKTLDREKQSAETRILTISNDSKLELIKQRIKVIIMSILYITGFNLINKIEN